MAQIPFNFDVSVRARPWVNYESYIKGITPSVIQKILILLESSYEKIRVVVTKVPDRPMPMSDEEHDRRPSRACRQSVGDDYYHGLCYYAHMHRHKR